MRKEELDVIKIVDKFRPRAVQAGYKVMVAPHSLDLKGEISWISRLTTRFDWSFDIHENTRGAAGVIVLFDARYPAEGKLAARLSAAIAAKAGVPNIGARSDTKTRFGRLGFVRQPGLNFVIECSDVDNKVSVDAWAAALLYAVQTVFPLPKITPKKTVIDDGRLHRVSLKGTELNYKGIIAYVARTTHAKMQSRFVGKGGVQIFYDGTLGFCKQIKAAILKYGYRSYVT